MAHEFKAGDLAIIIMSGEPDYIGRTVEILEVLLDTKTQYDCYGFEFEGRADGSPSAFVDLAGGDVWFFEQRKLMPLRGDFEPEQQKAKEAEPCA